MRRAPNRAWRAAAALLLGASAALSESPAPRLTLRSGEFYFSSEGRPTFVLGRNPAGVRPDQYAEHFRSAAAAGERFVRLHFTYFPPGEKPGEVAPGMLHAWDAILDAAERQGLSVLPVLGVWSDWNDGSRGEAWHTWEKNPFNALNGGPAKKPSELFEDTPCRALWLQRLDTLVRRWSPRPAIVGWEPFSELDLVTGSAETQAVAFAEQAAAVVRAADPCRRPVTASQAGVCEWPSLLRSSALDFIEIHPYANDRFGGRLDELILSTVRQRLATYRKPVLIGESGLDAGPPRGTLDVAPRAEVGVGHAVWAALVSGAMNGRALWWQDGYDQFEKADLCGRYARVAETAAAFVRGVDFAGFKPVSCEASAGVVGAVLGSDQHRLGWFRDRRCVPPEWPEEPVAGQLVKLDARDGAWRVEFVDPATGQSAGVRHVESQAGRAAVALPEFRSALAFRMTRLPPAPVAGAQELLHNPGFEAEEGRSAEGWSALAWGGASVACAPGEAPRGGARSQRVQVASLPEKSGAVYRQPFTFRGGHTYRGRVWLRSPDGARAQVLMRRAGPHYEPCAARCVEAGPEWREVTLAGGFGEGDVPGFFGVALQTPGTLELDDASLVDVSGEALAQPMPTNAMGAAFYGLHINKLGSHNVWPALGQGALRLWDTGTTWSHLEPRPGEWNWTRLDYYVRHAETHAPGCRLILTLGIPPAWACATNARSAYAGRAAPPLELEAWRRYVRAVGGRYRGRIRCWEPWNECDYGGFFSGGPAAMLPLARIAYEELKRLDPQNVVLSPNVTRAGLGWLDAYLAAGGGAWCDVLSFHRYPSGNPESDAPEYFAFRDLARAHGLGDKPLWNTEGAIEQRAAEGAAEAGAVARAWLVQWAQGVTTFCWYCWDIHWEKGAALGLSLTGAELSPAGLALAELVRWTDGAVMERREVQGGVWRLDLRRGGRAFWIVWRAGDPQPWPVPAEMGPVAARDVTGQGLELDGGRLTLGPVPVLLR